MNVSTEDPQPSYSYAIGGSLPINHPTYIERDADVELYQQLQAGNYCYVFNARQMGKSSLRVRVMSRLQAEGWSCVNVDLSALGTSEVTTKQWYIGLLTVIVQRLRLVGQTSSLWVTNWCKERADLDPQSLLDEFFSTVLLVKIQQNVVIFLDEIDSILHLTFSRDFITWIRACYQRAVDEPDYKRLRFVLIGVTTPSDLIDDKSVTAFNIGSRIDLTGFTMPAAAPLAYGLAKQSSQPEKLLEAVLRWTGGQPFLTQKICSLIQSTDASVPEGQEALWVKQLIHDQMIENWQSNDDPPHLKTVRDRILINETRAIRLLDIYRQILAQSGVQEDDLDYVDRMELRLSGLVVLRDGQLSVANPIYESVFDKLWIESELVKLRPYASELQQWLDSNGEKAHLLRGKELKNNLEKLGKRTLASEDFQFFLASLTEAKDDYEKKNKTLTKLRNLLIVLFLGTATACLASVAFGVLNNFNWKRLDFHLQGIQAQNSFIAGRQLEALLAATELGQHWQRQTLLSTLFPPPGSIFFALQQNLDHIQQVNRLDPIKDGTFYSVSFDPKGNYLAAGAANGRVFLWDLTHPDRPVLSIQVGDRQTPNNPPTIQPKNDVYQIRFTANQQGQQKVITASKDGYIRVWDLQALLVNRRELKPETEIQNPPVKLNSFTSPSLSSCSVPPQTATSEVFTPVSVNQMGQIAVASWDGRLQVWDLQGRVIAQAVRQPTKFTSVAFSQNGQIITGADNGTVQFWTMKGAAIAANAKPLKLSNQAVTSVSDNGKWLAAASSQDCVPKLWNLQQTRSGQPHQPIELIGFDKGVWQIDFSPNGENVAAVSQDETVRLWDLQSTSLNGESYTELRGHQEPVFSLGFSPNGQLATASADGTIRVWRPQNVPEWSRELTVTERQFDPRTKRDVFASVTGVQFTSGGNLITASSEGVVAWNLLHKPVQRNPLSKNDNTRTISFSLKGTSETEGWLVAASTSELQRWDVSETGFESRGKVPLEWNPDWGNLSSISLNQDGKLAIASSTGWIGVWDMQQETFVVQPQQESTGRIFSIKFSPDGQRLVTTSQDGTARIWKLPGGELLPWNWGRTTLSQQQELRHRIETSGDNAGDTPELFSANFSPDGQLMVSAARDGTVALWNLDGSQKQFIQAPNSPIFSAVFSPDQTRIVTASQDGAIRSWNLEGEQLAEFTGHDTSVYDLSFSPDGQWIASASRDGTVKIWTVENLDQLLARGCDWLQMYLDTQLSLNRLQNRVSEVRTRCQR